MRHSSRWRMTWVCLLMVMTACGKEVTFIEPEELTPSPQQFAVQPSANPSPVSASPSMVATAMAVAPVTAAPAVAATSASPVTPNRPAPQAINLEATCSKCHPFTTLAESGHRGAAWQAIVDVHATAERIPASAKPAVLAELKRRYP